MATKQPKAAKPANNKKRRLREVGTEFANAIASKPLPTEQKALQELQDSSLFKHDVQGSDEQPVAPVAKKLKTEQKDKKPSSKKRLHPTTIQKVNQLAENATEQKQEKVNPNDILPDYTKPVLRDFWAAGEGGLPPATDLAMRELRGKNPAEVLNEWNIGATQRISVSKTRKVHDKNKKQKHQDLVPLAGVSYNPQAEDHMHALVKLHEIQSKKNRAALERKADQARIKKLQEAVIARESKALEDNQEEESEDETSSVDLHFPQQSERKSRAQRHREQKLKTMQLEKTRENREKKLLNDLNKIKAISKELEKTEKEREERTERRKQALANREEKSIVKINGKRIPIERLVGSHPIPEVLAPSQLPDKMRSIPGVGGVIEDQYLKMRMQNVIETGRPKARGRKEAKMKKVRNVDKFDLEKITQRVAQPRFKVPAKLLKSGAS